jgi:hypothetical protein
MTAVFADPSRHPLMNSKERGLALFENTFITSGLSSKILIIKNI